METCRCGESLQRMHLSARRGPAAMAMHGLHGLETGRCIHGKTRKPTSHILSYLHDVRTNTKWCSVCKPRKDEPKFSAAAWQRARNGGRVCLACSGKAWGWWRCTVCKVKQAACALESWLAQHRSCNGDQVCSNCWKRPFPRGSISKAVQRVAATQAKVAVRAAEEKKGTCHC